MNNDIKIENINKKRKNVIKRKIVVIGKTVFVKLSLKTKIGLND